MTTEDRERHREGRAPSGARVFAVRVWPEPVEDDVEYRGSVRDVMTGAYGSFRDWTQLVAFLHARLHDDSTRRHDDG